MPTARITSYEYEFLKGDWPKETQRKAAYNAVFEFCTELGFCNSAGEPTPLGHHMMQQYEERYSK